MLATRVSRLLISATVTGLLLIGCKGHGSGTTIPQALTNWIWESGSDAANSLGYYDSTTLGSPTTTGQPSGRYSAMTWKDSSDNFWVFSGANAPNDLWKFGTSTLEWTWVGGSNYGAFGSSSVYIGVYPASYNYSAWNTSGLAPVAGNLPGQRNAGATWTDAVAGNLYMFGGYGTDANGLAGYLNDLWVYNIAANKWSWVGGSSQASGLAGTPVWGTINIPSTSNQPNPRSNSAFWTGIDGKFYMFGGQGFINNTTGAPTSGAQNDMWSFDPTTGEWTWLTGSTTFNSVGVYGTVGVTAATSTPGARHSATTWIDAKGNLWLYGGTGVDGANGAGQLGDLWKYTVSTNEWTWESGPSTINNYGVYGTNAVAASTNVPGARSGAIGWMDTSGNIWLLGGYGVNYEDSLAIMNDMWEFTPATGSTLVGNWTWYNGSYVGGSAGYYGTYQSLSTTNMPGSRDYASGYVDNKGSFWLFAGSGLDAGGSNGALGDLWKFYP